MNQIIQSKEIFPSLRNSFVPLRHRNLFDSNLFENWFDYDPSKLALDIKETDSEYRVAANLPGVAKEDISVSVKDSVLTISAKTSAEETKESDGRVIRQERFQGKFQRSLRLSDLVDEGRIEAKYKDGVLSLVVPKVEAEQPRKVEITVQ